MIALTVPERAARNYSPIFARNRPQQYRWLTRSLRVTQDGGLCSRPRPEHTVAYRGRISSIAYPGLWRATLSCGAVYGHHCASSRCLPRACDNCRPASGLSKRSSPRISPSPPSMSILRRSISLPIRRGKLTTAAPVRPGASKPNSLDRGSGASIRA
jgi:hypothetical protein